MIEPTFMAVCDTCGKYSPTIRVKRKTGDPTAKAVFTTHLLLLGWLVRRGGTHCPECR